MHYPFEMDGPEMRSKTLMMCSTVMTHEGTRNFSLAEFEKDKAYFIGELAKSKMKFQNFYFKNLASQAIGCDSGALGQALWLEVTYKSELSKVDTLDKFKIFADKLMKVLIDGEKQEKEI